MIENVAVLIVRGGSEYVLQHRDNLPTISDPDTYSTWGGRKEEDDTSDEEAAVRELGEEIGLDVDEADLKDLGQGEFTDGSPDNRGRVAIMHYFALEVDAGTTLDILEGQGIITLSKPYQSNPKVNAVAQVAIERYETAA